MKRCLLTGFAVLLCGLTMAQQLGEVYSTIYQPMGVPVKVNTGLVAQDSGIVIGGAFERVHERAINRLAKLKQDGTNDYSFDIGSGFNGEVNVVVEQPNGRLIVGGDFTQYNGSSCNRIVRLMSDGSRDTSFSIGTGFNGSVYDIELLTDGEMVVVGTFTTYNGSTRQRVAKLNSNGSLYSSFNVSVNNIIFCIARDTSGRLVIGGSFTTVSGVSCTRIARLKSSGVLDTAYSTATSGANNTVNEVALQAGGEAIFAGYFTQFNGSTVNRIVRLSSTGTVDGTYSSGSGFGGAQVNEMVWQSDGNLLVIGHFTSYDGTTLGRVVRLNSNGTRDTTFTAGTGLNYSSNAIWLNYDGSVFVGGTFTTVNGFGRLGLAKLSSSGSLDKGFMKNSGADGPVLAFGTQSSGKTIVAGDFVRYNGDTVNRIMRLNRDGSLDSGFGSGTGANGVINAVLVQPDDKIVIAGGFTTYNGVSKNRIARLNSDGSIDSTYQSGSGANAVINEAKWASSGKLYIAGGFASYNGTTRNRVCRLNSNGSLDAGFNAGTTFSTAVHGIVEQPDGKVIGGGGYVSGGCGGTPCSLLRRVDSTGAADNTFDAGTTTSSTTIQALQLQPDGKLLVNCYTSFNGIAASRMARLNTNGSVDTSFAGSANYHVHEFLKVDSVYLVVGAFTQVNSTSKMYVSSLKTDGQTDATFYTGDGMGYVYYLAGYCKRLYADEVNGRIWAGGVFSTAQGVVSNNIALFRGTYGSAAAIDSVKMPSVVCPGSSLYARFKNTRYFNEGNVFTAELSDSSGSFASAKVIGHKTATGAPGWDSVWVSIADTVLPGSHYRIRIKTSNAVYVSAASGEFAVGALPAAPPALIPQSACSDTAYTFVWDSVLAGSGGDSVEWSPSPALPEGEGGNWQGAVKVGSGRWQVQLTVASGTTDTLWLRSRNSATGCVSGSVYVTGRVNGLPEVPTYEGVLSNITGTVIQFTYKNVVFGYGTHRLEWTTAQTWDSLHTSVDTVQIVLDVDTAATKELWLRSVDTVLGCVSGCEKLICTNFMQLSGDSSRLVIHYDSICRVTDSYLEEVGADDEEDGIASNYMRWRNFWDSRVNGTDGDMNWASAAMLWYIKNPDSYCTLSNDETYYQSNWEDIGPKDDVQHKGRVNQIWVDPSDINHLVIGTTGGVWELLPGATSWVCLSDYGGIPSTAVASLAVNPTNNGDIRVGLGKSNSSYYNYVFDYGFGVGYRDISTGSWGIDEQLLNWYKAFPSTSTLPKVGVVAFKPGTSDFYVGVENTIARWNSTLNNYETLYQGTKYDVVADIQFSANHPNRVVAMVGRKRYNKILISEQNGDAGTWTDITGLFMKESIANQYQFGAGAVANSFGNCTNCWAISVDPFNPNNQVLSTTQPPSSTLLLTGLKASEPTTNYGIGPEMPWRIDAKMYLPAYTEVSLRLCDNIANTNTPDLNNCHTVPFVTNVTSTAMNGTFSAIINHNVNAFFPNVLISVQSAGGTPAENFWIDDVSFSTLSSGYCYDIVKDNDLNSATFGHDMLYVCTISKNTGLHIHKYDLDTKTKLSTITSAFVGFTRWYGTLQVNEKNHDVMYLGQDQSVLLKTTDGGLNFNAITQYNGIGGGILNHADIRAINLVNSSIDGSQDELYVGTDGGIMFSRTGGQVWLNFNRSNFSTPLVEGISSAETKQGAVLYGATDNGISLCLPDIVHQYINGGDGYEVALDRERDTHGFSQTGSGGTSTSVEFSTTLIGNWSFLTNSPGDPNVIIKQMFFHPWTNRLLFGAIDILTPTILPPYSSNISWQSINSTSTTTPNVMTSNNGSILAMWVGRNFDEDVQYVIKDGGTHSIYQHYYNSGTQSWDWREIKSPIGDENSTANDHFGDMYCVTGGQYWIKTGTHQPFCITADPDNPEHVWAGFGGITTWDIQGQNDPEPKNRVMYSANGGTTWCDVSRGLPIFGVTKIVYQEGTDDVLYAATDAGVYVWDKYYANATGPDGRWLCFSHNLPNCAITDLEIAQCEGKLRVGMWGRGIWQTDLPKIPAARIRYQEIAANTTWASSRAVNENMVVKSGATLTINNGAVIRLAKNVTITIEPGAKLVADGATLTNACGAMWGGIIVQGSKTLPQDLSSHNNATATSTNQGFVYLNNATIENAYEALRIWNPADGWVQSDDVSAQGGTGGIVRAVNTTFRNNRRSAEFMWYRGFVNGLEKDNLSYFYNCTFTTDDNHRMQHVFHAHVTAWGVRGIKFLGCTFENASTVTEQTSATKLGNGIVTIDAGITVGDYNPSLSIGGNNLRRSEFKNLEHGVYIMEENSIYSTIVTHAKFENCIRAIRNEGVNLCRFTGNEFTMGGNEASIPGSFLFNVDEGIVLHQATGFVVEQNTFSNVSTPAHLTIGIRADETGSSDNRIYKNTLNSVHAGNVANRVNTNASNQFPAGLRYECNTHSGNTLYDISVAIPNGPQQQLQGVKARQEGSNNEGSGNSFTSGPPLIAERDFYNSGIGIDYYHDGVLFPIEKSASVNTNLTLRNENFCVSNFTFPTESNPNGGGCITCLTFSGYSSAFSSHKAAQQNYRQQYLALIDGGSTQARMLMADTITNGSRLRDSLLAYSPNLSSTVLEKAAKSGLMNGDQKYPVMKTNAEGITYEIFNYLVESEEYTGWMLDSISAARSNLTLRSYLLDTLIYHTEQREQANYAVLRLIQEDTTGFNITTYREWLDSSDGLWAKREMVNTYLHEAKYDTIEALFAAYDTLVEKSDSASFKNFKDYTTAYASWMQADSSIMRLDSVHRAELVSIAEQDEHKAGSNAARNVLNFFYDSAYFTPAYLPEVQYGKKGNDDVSAPEAKQREKVVKELPRIKLYPNPAQDAVTIEYAGVADGSKLYVSDAMGVLHEMQILIGAKGKVILNTSSYTNGVYLARVETDSDAPLKSKFIILR